MRSCEALWFEDVPIHPWEHGKTDGKNRGIMR